MQIIYKIDNAITKTMDMLEKIPAWISFPVAFLGIMGFIGFLVIYLAAIGAMI